MSLRVVFMGTADLARVSLAALPLIPGLQIAAVVTQPDRHQGRRLKLSPSPVKQFALEQKWNVLQPQRARDEIFLKQLRDIQPDLIVVAAYGQILPPNLLEIPPHGCINVHTSLLPQYRGAAPIQWAIINGETETGVTIMKMDAGLDTGAILTQSRTLIEATDNGGTLHDRLAQIGADLLVQTIPGYIEGKIIPHPQPAQNASYARKISKDDERLDWTQPATALWYRIRALAPNPGTFTFLPSPSGLRIKIRQAAVASLSGPSGTILRAEKNEIIIACGIGSLQLLCLQPEGGRRMTPQEFLSGHPLQPGGILLRYS